MIQLNLLPDVKLEYIKSERSRALVLSVSVLVSAVAVALLLIMLIVGGLQKKHINDLTKDIRTNSAKLQKQPEINKILTVQNQLGSLTDLHSTKPAAAHLFDYLNNVTPKQASITSLSVDFTTQTTTITGTADSLSSVNKYIDTLKFTKYTSGDNSDEKPAFSNVVLTSFGVSDATKDSSQAANYTITLSYDPAIFDVTQNIKLIVPSLVTTRAATDSPDSLFTQPGGGN